MKKIRKNILLICVFSLIFLFILCFPSYAKEYAYLGLNVWFTQMIPSLLPFMILSSMLIGLNLDTLIVKPITGILRPIYGVSDAGVYVIVMGFLCGFPMGAKATVMEYEAGKLTKDEAEFLLSFVNNIGPAYFLSFVYGNIYPAKNLISGLFFMYGIPLLYGFLLRHTFYRKSIPSLHYARKTKVALKEKESDLITPSLFTILDTSITNGLIQISMLGGYMILCNLFVMIPKILFASYPLICSFFHNLLEISGGLLSIQALGLSDVNTFIMAHISLAFTGISCHLQTFHILNHSDLSCKKYMLHKIVLCSIVFLTLICIK